MTLTNSLGSDPERETMEIRGELEHDDHHKPKDAIVETKIRSDGVGGPVDEVDFIEMQTIDADVFLKAKCVCTDRVQTTATDFCKDCFREQMVSTTGTETLDDGGGAVERSDKGLRNTSEACANAGFNEAGEARQWQCVESDSGVYTREPSTDDSCKNSPEESCEAVTSLDRLDPGGASPNSSPTVPSRRPSHGTPCALSCTSIEERCAPASACSRESATDVAASDALESRVSQDHPPAATFLTQTSPENRADVSRRVPPQEPLRGSAADGQLSREHLSWGFRNGRLVFVESKSDLGGSRLRSEQVVGTDDVNSRSEDESVSNRTNRLTDKDILYSKDINKRLDENKSRLKYLEDKLKKAGITDDPTSSSHCRNCVERTICDCAQNTNPNQTVTVQNHHYNPARHQQQNQTDENNCGNLTIYADFQDNKDETKSGLDSNQNIVNNFAFDCDEFIPEGLGDICQFDVNNFGGFVEVPPPGYYDEFLEDSSTEESCSQCDEEDYFIVIRRMRGDGANMVNEAERSKHNPDRDNLKSLLKKPGRAKEKKSNRVVFNENKNEFFDADYIILIREECDYDEDDDDGVCTCNQHEMVRLTCCEPNCGCQGYDGFEPTPQSPKFAPPIEFVDAVTLSPPEGYKDMEMMGRGSQRGAVCRECSATHDDEIDDEDGSQSDSDMDVQIKENEEKQKTDQSQQTTPTTPPNSDNPENQNYILETITMTTVTQQQFLREAENEKTPHPPGGSPISGILKGGKLWKMQSQQSVDTNSLRTEHPVQAPEVVTSDDESGNRRSVRFFETEEKEKRDSCDGAPESSPEEEAPSPKEEVPDNQVNTKQETYIGNTSPETTEMMLTFKLGNHVLISNNSLKPNSAVRQLFPCTKSLTPAQGAGEEENSQQYLVTAESLRAFEEAKRSKLPQIIQSGETDETIKRAIERNTLRRSLIRYEPRSKKQPYKTDNSLVERIKQLTCNVDDNVSTDTSTQEQSSETSEEPSQDVLDSRSSPPGEEARNTADVNTLAANKTPDKSFSPSSSSTTSSNSSSMSLNSNYHQVRKLSVAGEPILMVDLKRVDNIPDIQNNFRRETKPLPDIGGPHNQDFPDIPRAVANPPDFSHNTITNKMSSSSTTSESRRQFLSTLAPLTACVTLGMGHNEDYYYNMNNHPHNQPGERLSVASSGTEYSLEDIDEGLKNDDEDHKRIAPDVLAGTPSASESGDELAMFVQQDAGRIERIKKKYQPSEHSSKDSKNDEDDENDDYGFNRRPSVRGIKPRFSTTTEILQQIQNQLQPPIPLPTKVAWPYYSESGLPDNSKQKNVNQNFPGAFQYPNVPEEMKTRGYPPQYRPTSLQDDNPYQNCANQRCSSRQDLYHTRVANDYYQSVPINRQRNGRPQSPPPMDMSKQYHQTMVYIPYNHIEGYQPVQYYHHTGSPDYVSRVSSQNQINKRYIEPVYQSRMHHHVDDHHYNPNVMAPPMPPKTLTRVPYPNGQPPPHLMASRSESPLPGQFSTARSTQTPAPSMSSCGYYPSNPRYRPMVGPAWQGESNYVKINRHSFPSVGPRYPPTDNLSLTDSDSQHSGSLPNGYRQSADISGYITKDSMPNSPTKPRFIERGVPEGAASVSPQDVSAVSQSSSSTMTSPTSPQNPPVPTNQKPLFYAMNV
ncbi:uncharacterized protein LOC143202797 isoform X2 [Rhynchophorus ferrugineus]|uniref:uncharacterized protein LOC143202797 isoform X2 n=1 Tax=Rhynchophorus ferrugineus TaxID=354439 RepID=UPI003FCE618A